MYVYHIYVWYHTNNRLIIDVGDTIMILHRYDINFENQCINVILVVEYNK